ncbi:MAG: PAS domain S-box protein [Calditrichaeota bacterium]|nr:PAS domain S-box protein [Calditrichota bacterium]
MVGASSARKCWGGAELALATLGAGLATAIVFWAMFGFLPTERFEWGDIALEASVAAFFFLSILARGWKIELMGSCTLLAALVVLSYSGILNLLDEFFQEPQWLGDLDQFGLLLGVVIMTFGLRRDRDQITQLIERERRAYDELHESESRYRAVFRSLAFPAFLLDPSGEILEANQTAQDLTGLRDGALIGTSLANLLQPPGLWEKLRNELENVGYVRAEASLDRASGETRILDVQCATIRLGGRKAFVALIRDLTDEREAERQRYLLSQAVEQMWDKLCIADSAGRAQYANQATWRSHPNLTDEDFLSTLLSGTGENPEAVWEVIRSGKIWRKEVVRQDESGRKTYEDMMVSPVEIESTGERFYLAICRDVTEKRKLEHQLLQGQKMQAVGSLAAGIAHEFNNLLGGILGYVSFLKQDTEPDSPTYPDLLALEQVVNRAADFTRQLLGFARQSSNREDLLSLNEIIRSVVNLLSHTVSSTIHIDTNLQPDLPLVKGDSAQIQQAVLNLCLNACDAMPDGGELRLSTETIERDGQIWVRLCVADTGKGMDEETLSRAFEPFFTTKPRGKGTGLGLSTTYSIVQKHGGTIEVESEVGKGTRFEITLPAADGQEKADSEERSLEEAAVALSATVLVVDDEPAVLNVAQRALQHAGFRVLTASSADEALALFSRTDGVVRVAVVDVLLPDGDGRELADKMAAHSPEVRVILHSGYSADAEEQSSSAPHIVGFLRKPVDPATLVAEVRKALKAS